ncbi:TPA: hypothetical protein ACTY2N_004461, partial [Klebsiella michiganensis]|uniref:hypothetical protein n=1 Tax=Klebsiella michiganensis TaxID=1134687 RepID=UPI0035D1F605
MSNNITRTIPGLYLSSFKAHVLAGCTPPFTWRPVLPGTYKFAAAVRLKIQGESMITFLKYYPDAEQSAPNNKKGRF